MTYHVTVREVDAQIFVLAGFKALDELVGYLGALHPRALLKGNYIGGNLDICLKLLGELAGAVAVPEVCHVSVLLSFGYCELRNAGPCKILTESIGYLGRIYEVLFRNVQVAVVFKHTGVYNTRNSYAVEFIKITRGSVKRAGYLYRAVAAEVVEYHAVAVFDRADGLAFLSDNKRGKILVYDVKLVTVCPDSLGS